MTGSDLAHILGDSSPALLQRVTGGVPIRGMKESQVVHLPGVISVDDRVVETPGVFERWLPARYRDRTCQHRLRKEDAVTRINEARRAVDVGANRQTGLENVPGGLERHLGAIDPRTVSVVA